MITIGNKCLQQGAPALIIAEMSGNHAHDINIAHKIIDAAASSGADAIKLQTYTPDTITLNSDAPLFKTQDGGLWAGRTLYDLYQEAHTPWHWHKELKEHVESLGLIFFSSPFDISAVNFLEELGTPCYKIASFEINDIQLIEYVAAKKKPIIISTGAAELADIEEAVETCRKVGNNDIILLKCTSAYPTPIEQVNLSVMPDMAKRFGVYTGLSDHTEGFAVAVGAAALGAVVIEKHLTLSHDDGAVDSRFSMEPAEFAEMVKAVRMVEKALGNPSYDPTPAQKESCKGRRSLFASCDISKGDPFTADNIKSVRPAAGLNTRYYNDIIGKRAAVDIKFATPLSWDIIESK